jgi:CRP-like cAMP-binding protein
MYVLVRGRVKVTSVHPDGQELIVRIIAPGEVFGAIAAFGDTVYPVSAEGVQAGEALAWDGETMGRLLLQYPTVALNALRILIARVHELQDRLSEVVTRRVEQRLAQTLLRLIVQTGIRVADGILLDMPLRRRDLADLAGTTLYTASRILSGWESKGLVAVGRQRVLVRDPHRLVTVAEQTAVSRRSSGR